ncbi:MAG: hypothetical protein EON59_11350 [Alphaproteobacteria bacterium]|nr:MAG: hypothetical protein EON59_11350 [Alphaproteobacteria bacterium]
MWRRIGPSFGALVSGGVYWLSISKASGVAEPWDDGAYWRIWYPLALLICALSGYLLKKDGWLVSAIFIAAQLPVMVLVSGIGPLLMLGLLLTMALAVPAVAVSAAATLVATRVRAT